MTDDYALDPKRVRAAFERAASRYEAAAFLAHEVGDRMLERLALLRRAPNMILDMGSGTGYCARKLKQRYPAASVAQLDVAHSMLQQARGPSSWWRRSMGRFATRDDLLVCADMTSLPFSARSFDMVWSNFALHWTTTPLPVFEEIRRVLRPRGVLMFSTLGPDTLKELRACFDAASGFAHIHRFVDLHDLGDMLITARFSDPVMDMETITLTYEEARACFRDLKVGSVGNLNAGRNPALTGKARFKRITEAYEHYRHDGRLPATFEIVYGQAWRAETEPTVDDGRAVIRFHSHRGASTP